MPCLDDTGHTGTDASFAIGHPEKLIDFGYRAVHETAVRARHDGRGLWQRRHASRISTACSGGGRMSFMEAQRYPQEFDAIIAGRAWLRPHPWRVSSRCAPRRHTQDRRKLIPATKYPAIPARGGERVGRDRRPQGRAHHRSNQVQVRPRGELVQGGDSAAA